MRKEVPSS